MPKKRTLRSFLSVLTPARIIAIGFLAIIFLGGFLLSLPIASKSGIPTPFLDSLFTATSATCVTGLVVYDTATHWSLFGQVVIITLIQIGGMGFVTVAIVFSLLRGMKVGVRQRSLMQESAGIPQMAGIIGVTEFIVNTTIAVELIGALLLSTQFIPRYGLFKGLWYGIFHSISGFCNAGFDLMGTPEAQFISMTDWVGNPVVNLTLVLLILIGGLGFITWKDIRDYRFNVHRYCLQSKIILATSAILLVLPFTFFFFWEFQQPAWSDYSLWEKFWAALFHTVTPRTAGFSTMDYTKFSEPGQLVTILLMLIGGAPGSTAGGIKLTTVAAVQIAIISRLHRKQDAEAFGRRLEDGVLDQAVVIMYIYIALFVLGGIFICIFDDVDLMSALFESGSAVATVGLSLGLTPTLSVPSRLILIFLMYLGRIGCMTLLYALANPANSVRGRFPMEKINVG